MTVIINGDTGVQAPGPSVIEANSTDPALRITQTGTGNALVVEDSANPDSTPMVVTTDGDVVVGYTGATPSTFPNTKNIQSHATAGRAGFTAARWDNSANGPQLLFGKSRGGAIGTNGIVSADDSLGAIYFTGDDGTDLVTAGAIIEAKVDGTPGTNDMPGRLVFSTTADGASSPSERMRIDSSGNVGIGMTPTNSLDISLTGASRAVNLYQADTVLSTGENVHSILFTQNDASYPASTHAWVKTFANGSSGSLDLAFATGGAGSATEHMRIDSAGQLYFNSGYGSSAKAYGCRAWVNFNGTGTVAIRGSGNVSSITDNGTGYYTVNLTNAMPDANYSVCVNNGYDATSNSGYRFGWCNATQSAPTTTSFGVTSAYGTSGVGRTSEDSSYLFVTVFR